MMNFKVTDYSNWSSDLRKLAEDTDKNDNVKGLSNAKEVIEFFNLAVKNGYDKESINELFGLSISANRARMTTRTMVSENHELDKIVDSYNSLDYIERSDVFYSANSIAYEKLAELEKDINIAFEECQGYALIKARRDIFEDRTRFDFQGVHDDVETALNSLNELQEKLEQAYDTAKGQSGSSPQHVDYKTQLENIALSTLGESYESFVAKHNLDFTKTITEAEAYNPNYENSIVYGKAKAYVNQIKRLAREELQRTRTDSGERLLDETVKYSDSVVYMVDFESEENITAEMIESMESAILRQSFIEAVKKESHITDVNNPDADFKQKDGKYYDKDAGSLYIVKNGKKYNTNGTPKTEYKRML